MLSISGEFYPPHFFGYLMNFLYFPESAALHREQDPVVVSPDLFAGHGADVSGGEEGRGLSVVADLSGRSSGVGGVDLLGSRSFCIFHPDSPPFCVLDELLAERDNSVGQTLEILLQRDVTAVEQGS